MPDRRWVAAGAEVVRLVPLDLMTLAYHRPSGITHLLAPPAPELLATLDTPMTLAELMARLAAEYDLPDADADALAARLEELWRAGLVARA